MLHKTKTINASTSYSKRNIKHSSMLQTLQVKLVDEVAGILGLEGAKNTQVKYLSGGEKKRLSIDVELMNNPPVLFFDEPISSSGVVLGC
ncbi:ATP-binding cassette sub-family G member 4-like isoform X2 [Lycorma delicatula]|uniref:ATP-binding cassette sub-family G member 4-like isoform X2 n=1 Tax=Lycorma delicatula TaxID=130591 RepID=UPI003F512AD6